MRNISNKVINYTINRLEFINFISKHKRILIPSFVIISYLFFYLFIDFSTQSLVAHDEGLYARRSRLIEESFNWFSSPFSTPHHKTLGSYWLIALSIRLFGTNEFALRLPSLVCSFLCLISTYFIALKISNKKAAFIAVFSLSSIPLWIQYSRYASPDMPFVLCILLVILFFLKFLESKRERYKFFYILISGLFISTSFFIRSYMMFVPLIGLSPFLAFHLFRTKNFYRSFFILGFSIGSIPTAINLFYSYKKFGISGISSLFDFARKQAFGGFDFINLLLTPLNYLYLTFPIGILFVILLLFTKSNNKIKYPLLIYFYPLVSFVILLFMSTTYPHYYLFLLPSLSLLFSVNIQSYTYRFLCSKELIKYLLISLVTIISLILVSVPFFYNKYFVIQNDNKSIFIYIISTFIIFSFIFSLRYLYDTRNSEFNLIKFLYNLIIPQYISLSLLYNFGVIGNPNQNTKLFLNDKNVSSIISNNTIYLYNVDSKIQTLLSYYLPHSEIIKSPTDIEHLNYVITSDISILKYYEDKSIFKLIDNIDNHFLLINISK